MTIDTRTTSPVTTHQAATVERPAPPWRALPVILLGALITLSSYFMVNLALEAIARDLHASNSMLSLITAGYSLSYAATLVAGGRLGDRYGRRRLFIAAVAGFAVASAASGFAVSGWTLTAGRLLQGAAAGLLMPQVLGTIQAAFPASARARALGWFGAVAGLACVLGQLLGGAAVTVDTRSGWRAGFLVYLPIGLAVAVAARRWVPETRGRATGIDVTGALLLTLVLGLTLVPLTLGSGAGWPLWTWVALAAVVPAAGYFLHSQRRLERRAGSPLLPLSLFRLRPFRNGLLVAGLFFGGVGGFFLTTALTMQVGLGLAPMSAALVLVPYSLGFLLVSLVVARLVARFGGAVIVTGALVLAAGMAALAGQAASGYAHLRPVDLAPALAVVGVGQALVMVPLFGVILAQIPVDRAGVASGVLATVQQATLALGVAALGTLFFSYAGGAAGGPGWRDATVAVFVAQAGLALLIALAGYLGVARRGR